MQGALHGAQIKRRVGHGVSWGASFFFNDTSPTEIYSLSLHDALPTPQAQRQRDLSPRIRHTPAHPVRRKRDASLPCLRHAASSASPAAPRGSHAATPATPSLARITRGARPPHPTSDAGRAPRRADQAARRSRRLLGRLFFF